MRVAVAILYGIHTLMANQRGARGRREGREREREREEGRGERGKGGGS